jgi:hypothetical protein
MQKPGHRSRDAAPVRTERRRAACLLSIALAATAPAASDAQPSSGCVPSIELADTGDPDTVVGNGTPASCTDAALAAAIADGGVVTFDCGPDPITISVTSAKAVMQDTVVDGGGLVTLDGGHANRIFTVPSSFERGWPTLTVQRLRFVRGSSVGVGGSDPNRSGGAIWVLGGSLRVLDSSFEDNRAPATGQDVAGGAIYSVGVGSVTVVRSTFANNTASSGGAIGALHSDLALVDTVIADNDATGTGGNPGNGGNGGGVYSDGNDQVESLCGVTLARNHCNVHGGGWFRVSNNGVGPMTIDRSSVLDNTTSNTSPASAGGMYLQGVQIALRDSTIAGNESRFAGGLFLGPNGTTLDFENVTIAENTAISGLAGGMAISSGVTGEIRNATIARNAAPGPVAFAGAATGGNGVVLANSIVDGSIAGNAWNPISCLAPFVEGGGNLQWPVLRASGQSDVPGALCSAGVTVADSQLGALASNGGPTLTIAPSPASPALVPRDDCPAFDQRGWPRDPDACTAGALELLPEPDALLGGLAAATALAALRRRVSSARR